MRFAVCYSGQCRFPERRFGDNHKKFIFDVLSRYGSMDFFLHFWKSGDKCREGKLPDLDSSYGQDLLNLIQPKSYLFEDQKNLPNQVSMYLSMMNCNTLKSVYEHQKDFKYDLVLRMRADFGFNHELPGYVIEEPEYLHCRSHGLEKDGINDQFAVGNSSLMNVYQACFNTLMDIEWQKMGPEGSLKEHLVRSNVIDKVKELPKTLFWF